MVADVELQFVDGTVGRVIVISDRIVLRGISALWVLKGTIHAAGARIHGASGPYLCCHPHWAPQLVVERAETSHNVLGDLDNLFKDQGLDWCRNTRHLLDKLQPLDSGHALVLLQDVKTVFGTQFAAEAIVRSPLKLAPFCTSAEWEQLVERIQSSQTLRQGKRSVIVAGQKGSGKSCLIQYLSNRLITATTDRCEILLLDVDVGQPLIGLPGSLSLHLISQPILNLSNHSNCIPRRCPSWCDQNEINRDGITLIKSIVLGQVTPEQQPQQFLRAIFELQKVAIATAEAFQRAKCEHDGIVLLVNGFGWISGLGWQLYDAAGALTSCELLIMVGPAEKVEDSRELSRALHSEGEDESRNGFDILPGLRHPFKSFLEQLLPIQPTRLPYFGDEPDDPKMVNLKSLARPIEVSEILFEKKAAEPGAYARMIRPAGLRWLRILSHLCISLRFSLHCLPLSLPDLCSPVSSCPFGLLLSNASLLEQPVAVYLHCSDLSVCLSHPAQDGAKWWETISVNEQLKSLLTGSLIALCQRQSIEDVQFSVMDSPPTTHCVCYGVVGSYNAVAMGLTVYVSQMIADTWDQLALKIGYVVLMNDLLINQPKSTVLYGEGGLCNVVEGERSTSAEMSSGTEHESLPKKKHVWQQDARSLGRWAVAANAIRTLSH